MSYKVISLTNLQNYFSLPDDVCTATYFKSDKELVLYWGDDEFYDEPIKDKLGDEEMPNKKILYEYAINDLNEDGEVTGNMVGMGSCYAANDEQAKMRAVLMEGIDEDQLDGVEVLVRPFR